jgi:hypothetical protein
MTISASALNGRIVAALLACLREEVTLPRTVNVDYSADAAKQGDAITIGVPTALATYDVTPAAVPPAIATTTLLNKSISLSRWKAVRFDMTSKNMLELADPQAVKASQMGEQVRALASELNVYLMGLYTGVYWHSGAAGTTPYASAVDGTIDSRTRLNRGLAPESSRNLVLDYAAESNALKLAAFSDAEKTGNPDAKIKGQLAEKFGMLHLRDGQVPLHTAGTASAATITTQAGFTIPAGVHAQDVTIPLKASAGTPTLVAGDVLYFTVSGIRYEFVVVTGITLSTSDQNVACRGSGGANGTVAVAGTTGCTVAATHRVNLAYHRNAFALAVRPTLVMESERGRAQVFTDDVTKLSFKLMNLGGYHSEQYEMSILYGASLVREEWAARLLG